MVIMQSGTSAAIPQEDDWDEDEDWDDDYDDSSSALGMEIATKMKLAGAVGIVLLIILSSTIFTNFGFYSGAGSISVLIDVNEGKDANDNTFTFNILATSPAFGKLAKEGDYTITNVPSSVEYSGGSISAFSGSFELDDDGRGSVSVAYSDFFKMNGRYNLEVELGSQKATTPVSDITRDVPPVDIISIPLSDKALDKYSIPDLSLTLIKTLEISWRDISFCSTLN
jgi:hypothetical protein